MPNGERHRKLKRRTELIQDGIAKVRGTLSKGVLPTKASIANALYKTHKHDLPSPNPENFTDEEWLAIFSGSVATETRSSTASMLNAVCSRLGLEEIVLAHSEDDIPQRAALWFLEHVLDEATVSVTCGRTLARMVERLRGHRKRLQVFSSICLCSDVGVVMPPSAVANAFLHGQDGVSALTYAMPRDLLGELGVSRERVRNLVHRSLLQPAANADFVFFGIGATMDPTTTFGAQVASARAAVHLQEDFCGEVFFCPYDASGSFHHLRPNLPAELHDFYNRTFTVEWDDLERDKRRGKVIAVAGGTSKAQAIRVALTKLSSRKRPVVDVLITDPDTLHSLYRQTSGDHEPVSGPPRDSAIELRPPR